MEIVLSDHVFNPGFVDFDTWISRGLKRKGRGAGSELARRLGISPVKVTKMKLGVRDPQAEELAIIESFLEEPAPSKLRENIERDGTERRLRVVGYVGAGSSAHFYAVSQGDLDTVAAPTGASEKTVAVEIRGDSLGSMFNRWLVFYDDVRAAVTPDLLGRLCVIGTADGRILVKEIKRGKSKGVYDLYSANESPMRNISVEWAATVKLMTPR